MATKTQINDFLRMIVPIAVRQAKKHGMKIYPSVCIAQACHESGWGTSKKMINANALYGIKVGESAYHFGKAWKGKAYKTGTTEYYDGKNPTKIVDWFRAYDSIEDATEDYFDLLCTAKRYRGALNQHSPKACIDGIVRGGYATGPKYANHIMATINSYDLTRFDSGNENEWSSSLNMAIKSVIRTGSRGDYVTLAQTKLNQKGMNLKVDGIFGKNTKDAVVKFQKENGLVADGVIGPNTWNKLLK